MCEGDGRVRWRDVGVELVSYCVDHVTASIAG